MTQRFSLITGKSVEGPFEELVRDNHATIEDLKDCVKDTDEKMECDICGKELGCFELINPEESSVYFTCTECKMKYT